MPLRGHRSGPAARCSALPLSLSQQLQVRVLLLTLLVLLVLLFSAAVAAAAAAAVEWPASAVAAPSQLRLPINPSMAAVV